MTLSSSLPFTTSHAEWIGLLVGTISLIGIGGVVSMLFCHHHGCWRRGRFRHGQYRLCHVHHPHVPSDGKITDEHIARVRPLEAEPADAAEQAYAATPAHAAKPADGAAPAHGRPPREH